MSKLLLSDILENLNPELDDENEISQSAFDLVDVFVEKYFKEDFCQILIDSIEKGTDLRKVARILDILVWSTPDNGVKLNHLTHNWLKSNKLNKVLGILLRKDWLPSTNAWKQESQYLIQFDADLTELIDYYTAEIAYQEETGLRNYANFKIIVNKLGDKIYSS